MPLAPLRAWLPDSLKPSKFMALSGGGNVEVWWPEEALLLKKKLPLSPAASFPKALFGFVPCTSFSGLAADWEHRWPSLSSDVVITPRLQMGPPGVTAGNLKELLWVPWRGHPHPSAGQCQSSGPHNPVDIKTWKAFVETIEHWSHTSEPFILLSWIYLQITQQQWFSKWAWTTVSPGCLFEMQMKTCWSLGEGPRTWCSGPPGDSGGALVGLSYSWKNDKGCGGHKRSTTLAFCPERVCGVGLVLFCPSESIGASSSPHPGAQREDRQALESDTRELSPAFASH